MPKIILFNKPYGILSQFTPADGHPGLKSYLPMHGFYPAGRLDHDSEGLLLLTDDGQLQARITQPKNKMPKTYWVQVEGELSTDALHQLRTGISLNDGKTLPAEVSALSPPQIWPRNPPIRQRKQIPTHWLELTITEGRNRQIRRMTAAVGLPTLRLIRRKIGPWELAELMPGDYRIETVHLPSAQTTRPANKRSQERRKRHHVR